MRLGTISVETPVGAVRRVGVDTPSGIVDVTAARISFHESKLPKRTASRVGQAELPPDLVEIIGGGETVMDWVREAVDHVLARGRDGTAGGIRMIYKPAEITLLAPVPRPPGMCCFITWSAHIEDSVAKGYTMLKFPQRAGTLRAYYKGNCDSVVGPGTTLCKPPYASYIDVECEFAAVVGPACKDVSIEEARRSIAGYTVYNDVSFREIQNQEMQFGLGPTKGKDADGSNVLGPWLVTPDEVGDVRALRMSFHLNGEEKSSYSTSEMAWDHADLLSYVSAGQTIHPGHLLTSGCYPGGSALDLGIRLHAGDRVSLQIDRLGALESVIG